MHPLLATRSRLTLYLLAWLPPAALLGYLLAVTSRMALPEAEALAVPLALFYSLICLAPWYMCRVMPLGPSQVPKLLGNHAPAAIAAALAWIVLAKLYGLALGRYYFPDLNDRFSPELPLLFGVGVLLYLLAVALHYVLLSLETSKEAETREQEARTLAREAELKALKAQINPHFLFNSLNSISALATVDGVRAREMCIKLSDFLRSTLKLGEQSSISLKEELALAKSYLDVEQIRFGPRLRTEFHADEHCDDCVVPPLFLQPLVENAVKHGIAGLVDGGTIRLEAACEDGRLHVTVQNEFDPDAPPSDRRGLGLVNVRGRLRALYEQEARLDARALGDQFIIEVVLPCAAHQ